MIGNDYYLQDLELFVAPALLVVYVNMEVKNDSLLCLRHAPKFTLNKKKKFARFYIRSFAECKTLRATNYIE